MTKVFFSGADWTRVFYLGADLTGPIWQRADLSMIPYLYLTSYWKWTTMSIICDKVAKTSQFHDRTRLEVIRTRLQGSRTRLQVIRQAGFQMGGGMVGIKTCRGSGNIKHV